MKEISQVVHNLPDSGRTAQDSKDEAPKHAWLVLPYLAQEDINSAQKHGRRYMVIGPEKAPSKSCPNCWGMGHIWIRFTVAGPFASVPTYSAGETATWKDDGWYRVLNKYYPCPMCSDPNNKIPFLFELSGLEPTERTWSVDFIKGMPGKESGLAQANFILGQLPQPKGFTCFYGAFGVGKSGIIKAIVSQCITRGIPACYIRAADLLRDIRSTFSETAQLTEADITRRFADYPLLAIDEVDRISSTAWSMGTLMTILDNRYNHRTTQATLLVTNQDPDHLPPGFEYLVSRMRDGDRTLIGGRELRG